MPKYEITIQESGRYTKVLDADDDKDVVNKVKKELTTYGTGDWFPQTKNSFVILNIDEIKGDKNGYK